VLLASPSNPTGTMIPREELRAIIARCDGRAVRRDGRDLSGIGLRRRGFHGTRAGDDVFVVNSFSKYFNMTGWRLGWIVAPEIYVREIEKLAQNASFVLRPASTRRSRRFGLNASGAEERRQEFPPPPRLHGTALRDLGFEFP